VTEDTSVTGFIGNSVAMGTKESVGFEVPTIIMVICHHITFCYWNIHT